ncbi:MAG: hypothetical protein ACXVB0_19910 [Mucilaginibacter sp.]
MATDGRERRSDKLKEILSRKIIPAISKITGVISNEFEMAVIQHSRIFTAVKDQFIEENGLAEDGHLIYFESGIARCYYYHTIHKKYCITRITRKDEVVIDINAYLNGFRRMEDIQMLESGTLITIAYSNLKILLSDFPEIFPAFLYLWAEREKQHIAYQHLLKLMVAERARIFLGDNPGIATRINNDHIANYLNMSRTTFSSAYARYKTELNNPG